MARYHVFSGNVGCLPDGDAMTFETLTDARRFMRDEARDYREAGSDVSGNMRDGYWFSALGRIYAERCDDADCDICAEYDAA